MATYEMFWDCEFCGTTKLLGLSHRHCPSCGAPQNPDKRYFPPESEKIAVENHQYHGADKQCAACGTANAAITKFCVNCGSPVDEAHSVRLAGEPQESATPEPPESPAKKWRLVHTLAVAGTGLAGFILLAVFWTRTIEVQVTGHNWDRKTDIEKFQITTDSGWCDSIPSDAYSISRSRQQRSTNRIADGQTCRTVNRDNGDGTYTQSEECETNYREEPVYDDYCNYSANRWKVDQTLKASGSGRENVYWPPTRVSGGNCLGCTREGKKSESYELTLVIPGKADSAGRCEVSEHSWRSVESGSMIKVEQSVILGAISCGSLSNVDRPADY